MTGAAPRERLFDPCGFIRWKGMFIDVQPDPNATELKEHICWCVKTQNCLGPDGEVVAEDTCSPYRSCYQQ